MHTSLLLLVIHQFIRSPMPVYLVQLGPAGDTKITRVGKGKMQVHGNLNVEETLNTDNIIIDGVPLQQYIEKMIQAAMG